jgi:preprotein translocase subunit SecB
MNDKINYPYELVQSFFVSASFKRANEVSQPVEMQFTTEVNVAEPKFPNLQIGIKVKSPDESPINFDLHLIGLFEYKGENVEYDHTLNIEYALQRGLYLLWPNIVQIIKVTTAQMGIPPLQVRTPITFGPEDMEQKSHT